MKYKVLVVVRDGEAWNSVYGCSTNGQGQFGLEMAKKVEAEYNKHFTDRGVEAFVFIVKGIEVKK